MSELLIQEIAEDLIAGLIFAAVVYVLIRYLVLGNTLKVQSSGVKFGLFISTWIVCSLITFARYATEVELLGDSSAMIIAAVLVVLEIIGAIAFPKTLGKGQEKLSLRPRLFVSAFFSLFLLPWWLFGKKD
ncbi:MAG: hypothetical protein IJR63_01650 [Synergistaceae bacterium]|nr:hypothetical protein [Synergistaceae bacterium]